MIPKCIECKELDVAHKDTNKCPACIQAQRDDELEDMIMMGFIKKGENKNGKM